MHTSLHILNATLHALPNLLDWSAAWLAMNTKGFITAEMLLKTLKTINAQILNTADTKDKCECCLSVYSSICPSVCHTLVSVT